MNALHLGGVAKNWGGRVAATYEAEVPAGDRGEEKPASSFESLVLSAVERCGETRTVAQIGYYKGDVTRVLAMMQPTPSTRKWPLLLSCLNR